MFTCKELKQLMLVDRRALDSWPIKEDILPMMKKNAIFVMKQMLHMTCLERVEIMEYFIELYKEK